MSVWIIFYYLSRTKCAKTENKWNLINNYCLFLSVDVRKVELAKTKSNSNVTTIKKKKLKQNWFLFLHVLMDIRRTFSVHFHLPHFNFIATKKRCENFEFILLVFTIVRWKLNDATNNLIWIHFLMWLNSLRVQKWNE